MRSFWVLLFLLIGCRQVSHKNHDVIGFWIREQMNWEFPPQGLELDSLRFTYTSTLYFSSDGTFKIFHWMLLKVEPDDSMGASLGDGFSLHLGNWHPSNPREVLVKYRLIYRSIAKIGETLPGEEIPDTVAIIDSRRDVLKLKMNEQIFVKSTKLTAKTRWTIERFKGAQIH